MFVFLSLHARMLRCTQHNVYTSQHITRTVSTTVYGIYVFWLQGMYTRESFASTWINPPSCWWDRCCSSFFFVFCDLCLYCLSSVCVLCAQCCQFFWTVPLVFSTVYLLPKFFDMSYVPNVASFSKYFILDCPFGVLQRLIRIEIAFIVSIISFANTNSEIKNKSLLSCRRISVDFLFG